MKKLKFIDLFAGLGGFHLALQSLGHECVFASEINTDLRKLYKINHGIDCAGDINLVNVNDIQKHDIVCAGFPCQPFSKAGKQNGLEDPDNGNFFNLIMKILNTHNPEYVFLENVPNLKSHDDGNTWEYIYNKLSVDYDVKEEVTSPHKFGIIHYIHN
ncbi:MAG: DNA cytosine methyltransferase [Saprospiraceae bacterium]